MLSLLRAWGSTSGWGAKTPQAMWCIKKKFYKKSIIQTNFYWSIVDLQCGVSAVQQGESVTLIHISTRL